MTGAPQSLDISSMIMTTDEFVDYVETERKKRGWSLRQVGLYSDVPYSWLIDQDRNRPRKLDAHRAQKVKQAFEARPPEDNKAPRLSETESALYEALQGVIKALCHRGNKAKELEDFLANQIQAFSDRRQQGAAEVLGGLLDFLHSQEHKAATPVPPQSRRRGQDRLDAEKNPKN